MLGCCGQILSILSVQLVLTTPIPRNREIKVHLFEIKVTGIIERVQKQDPQKDPPPLEMTYPLPRN